MNIKTTIVETPTEEFAALHADQWWGCMKCKKSHHKTSFCKSCRACFYHQKWKQDPEFGTFVYCECGENDLWD